MDTRLSSRLRSRNCFWTCCACLFLCASACGDDVATDSGPATDGSSEDAPEDGSTLDALFNDAPSSDAPLDVAARDSSTQDTSSDGCAALREAGYEVCTELSGRCEAVFTDGIGCTDLCAIAGLACVASFEDIDGMCSPNRDEPALDCGDTEHRSDFCECGATSCGDGTCGAGETCSSCATDCGACTDDYRSLVRDAVGFAMPSGGRDGSRIVVTSLAASGPGTLREALSMPGRWISFQEGLSGTISGDNELRVPSNTTIDGRGADITLAVGLEIVGVDTNNIILHNLAFDGPVVDAVQIRNGADEVWIDHCSFRNWGDGAIDVTNGVVAHNTRVTVSWCAIYGGSKAMLISATSDPSFGHVDENLYVTHHHNYFEGVSERMPRARFAKIHHFNNVNVEWRYYGVAASTLAEVIVENNVFDAGAEYPRACRSDCLGGDCEFVDGVGGSIRASGNLLDGGEQIATCPSDNEAIVFDEFPDAAVPYDYVLEPADDALRTSVRSGAGPQDVPYPPDP